MRERKLHYNETLAVYILFGILLIPAVLLNYIPSGYHFPKVVLLHVFAIPLSAILITMNRNEGYSLLDIFLSLLYLYLLFQRFLLGIYIEHSDKFFIFSACIPVYLAAKQAAKRSKVGLLLIISSIIIASICNEMYSILQLLDLVNSNNANFRVTGSFYHPAPLAIFIATSTSISLGASRLRIPLHYRRFFFALLIVNVSLGISILLCTNSRTAIISAAASFIIINVRYLKLRNIGLPKPLLLAITLLVISIGALIIYRIRPDSIQGRWLIWKIATNNNENYSIFGAGLDSFKYVYPGYQITFFQLIENLSENNVRLSTEVTFAFNEFIQFLIEIGLLGFAILLLIYFTIINSITRPKRANCDLSDWKVGAIRSLQLGLVPIGLSVLSSYPFSDVSLTLTLFVLLGATSAMHSQNFRMDFKVFNTFKLVLLVAVFTILIQRSGSFPSTFYALQEWSRGKRTGFVTRDFDRACHIYSEIFPILRNRMDFIFEYGVLQLSRGDTAKALTIFKHGSSICLSYQNLMMQGLCEEKLGNFNDAVKTYETANSLLPHKLTPVFRIMEIYRSLNQNDLSKDAAMELLRKPVKMKSEITNLMRNSAEKVLNSGR